MGTPVAAKGTAERKISAQQPRKGPLAGAELALLQVLSTSFQRSNVKDFPHRDNTLVPHRLVGVKSWASSAADSWSVAPSTCAYCWLPRN
jgi:hypothetical protein